MESPIEQQPTLDNLSPTPPPGDAIRGATLFAAACAHCHNVQRGQPHKFGPTLDAAYGARAGRIPGSRPSEAMRRVGDGGVVWGRDTLFAYLADCRGYVPGSKKPFKGVESERDRIDIVAFLQEKASSSSTTTTK
ncbi:cytochrome c-like domain-containing protein [Phyllosticta citribraziliensis]|uniref:Cytochrome c-like domain-containing protein n=1 Tax=Phyllosticta citribraziliensis TaxID=989973 RepID=A0ABR1LTR9_9PEZI